MVVHETTLGEVASCGPYGHEVKRVFWITVAEISILQCRFEGGEVSSLETPGLPPQFGQRLQDRIGKIEVGVTVSNKVPYFASHDKKQRLCRSAVI